MISLDKLVEVGFTLSQATNLTQFFRNIGDLTVGTNSVVDGYEIPSDNVVVIDTIDTLKGVFKSDSQEYTDIETILIQKNNPSPNRGRTDRVVVYFATLSSGETMGDLVDEMISVNANYAQLLINSKNDNDIVNVAAKALANDRLFVAQTSSSDVSGKTASSIAKTMKDLNNSNVLLCYHDTDTECLAGGIASIMANPNLGAVGSLYSTVTNVTPKDYISTVNANLDDQNVSYYSMVNPINGGGVSQYSTPIFYGGYMINGEDAKRRYIRYYLNRVLKARSIDFLKKKLGYEYNSSNVLLAMLNAVMVTAQNAGLIRNTDYIDDQEVKGFELNVLTPAETRLVNEDAYNTQTYLVNGYYIDSLTGRRVEINLAIDPSEAEKAQMGF